MNRGAGISGVATALLLSLAAGASAQPPRQPADAERDYVLHCRGCHGVDGTGIAHRVPAVRGSLPAFMRISDGREFVLRVPGAANSRLSDAALAAVLNWMAATFAGDELGPDPQWFSAAEVTAARGRPLLGVRSVRRELVRQLAASGIRVVEDY